MERISILTREKHLALSTLILSFGTILPKFAALVTLPVLTCYLAKEDYGAYDLLLTVVELLLPLSTMRVDAAAFRFLIDNQNNEKEKSRIITTVLGFIFVSTLTLAVIINVFITTIPPLFRILASAYFIIETFLLTLQMIVRGLSLNKLYSISAIVSAFSGMVLMVLFVAILHLQLDGAALALTCGITLAAILLFFKANIFHYLKLRYFSFKILKQLLKYSWPMVPGALSLWIIDLSDKFVITGFLGLAPLAIYTVAQKLPNMFSSLQMTFTYAWQESASMTVNDTDKSDYYSLVLDLIFRLLTGTLAILITIIPLLFNIFVKGDYSESLKQMPILLMAILFSAFASFFEGIYVANKETKKVGLTTALAAVVNVIINLSLIQFCGLYAASVSTLLSFVFLTIYRFKDIKKTTKLSADNHTIASALFILTIMCFCFWKQGNVIYINFGMCPLFILLYWRPLFSIIRRRLRKINI